MIRAVHHIVALLSVAVIAAACGPKTPPVDPDDNGNGNGTSDASALDWSKSGVDWTKVPEAGPEPVFAAPKPVTFALNNGMQVIVLENRRLPLVSAIMVGRHGGNINDVSGKSGLAGLTADLLDEGTSTRTALEIADELERLGADLRVGASTDYMTASMDTLASTLDSSLALFAEVIRDPAFTDKDFERVKGDRLASITRRRDRPRSVAGLVFDRVVFGAYPYAFPVLGLEADVEALTRDSVTSFYRNHYSPKASTLIVAGDVSAAELESKLESTFGLWESRGLNRRKLPAVNTADRPFIAVVDKPDAPQTVVHIGRVSMDRSDARYFQANVINTVIGGSFASRLNHRLREQLGYTYGIRSSFWMGNNTGSWSVRTSLNAPNTLDGIKEILAIIEGARTADIPADELAKSKQLRIRQLPQEFETNAGTASAFADLVAAGVKLDWYDRYADGIASVTASLARDIATSEWKATDMVMVVVGDLATLRPQLETLGFGPIVEYDPEGREK
jgi:zinc protease